MSYNSNSPQWHAVHDAENLLAAICELDTRRAVLKAHIRGQSKNWTRMFYEIEMMRPQLAYLREQVSRVWDDYYHIAVKNGLPRGDGS